MWITTNTAQDQDSWRVAIAHKATSAHNSQALGEGETQLRERAETAVCLIGSVVLDPAEASTESTNQTG